MLLQVSRALRIILLPLALVLVGPVAVAEIRYESEEVRQRREVSESVLKYWQAENFDALEVMAEQLFSTRARVSSGQWKLAYYFDTFNALERAEPPGSYLTGTNWRRIERWLEKQPASLTAVLVKVEFLFARAVTVPSATRTGFPIAGEDRVTDFVGAARALLIANESRGHDTPMWYHSMLGVLDLERANDEVILQAYLDAIAAYPPFECFHYAAIDAFYDRWISRPDRMETLANTAAQAAGPEHGPVVYASFYNHYAHKLSLQELRTRDVFSWSKVRADI